MHLSIPTIVLLTFLSAASALPWKPQRDRPEYGEVDPTCTATYGYFCNSPTNLSSCDIAISQACTFVSGNDGYSQNINATSTITYPPGDPNACVVDVEHWNTTLVGATAYANCVVEFQKITTQCFDPALDGLQKGAGGSINGNVLPTGPGALFGPTAPSNDTPKYYVRAEGCKPASIGWLYGNFGN